MPQLIYGHYNDESSLVRNLPYVYVNNKGTNKLLILHCLKSIVYIPLVSIPENSSFQLVFVAEQAG